MIPWIHRQDQQCYDDGNRPCDERKALQQAGDEPADAPSNRDGRGCILMKDSNHSLRHNSHWFTRTALFLAIVSVCGSLGAGILAYRASHDAAIKRIHRDSLQFARMLGLVADSWGNDRNGAPAAARLESHWHEAATRFKGSYLCIIDAQSRLLTHTARPDLVGTDVGQLRVATRSEGGPISVRELLKRQDDWVGETTSIDGNPQMIAFAYNATFEGLIAIHLPVREVEGEIQRAALPWGIAIGIVTLTLLPGAFFLMHRAFRSAQTDAARMTRELRENEQRVRAVLNTAVDAIVTIDDRGRIETFNAAAERIFGYGADEVIGCNVNMLMPEPYHSEHDSYIGNYLRTGIAKIIDIGRETEGRRKDGSVFSLGLAISEFNAGGRRMFAGILRDISERRQYQQQLRSLSAELAVTEERQRRQIATDLHDQIGQTLAIAKIKLGQLRQAASSTEHAPTIDQIRDMVEQSIQTTRSLTFELGSPVLYELGLEAALETLGEDMERKHGLRCIVSCIGPPVSISEQTRVLLFRASRELLVNVVKHAHAASAQMTLEQGEGEIVIRVEDDGKGFEVPESGFKMTHEGGFGLFNIAERLDHSGGRVEVESTPGKGTRVTLAAPIETEPSDEPKHNPGG